MPLWSAKVAWTERLTRYRRTEAFLFSRTVNCGSAPVPCRFTAALRSSVRLPYSGTLGSPTIMDRWSVKYKRSEKSTFGQNDHFTWSALRWSHCGTRVSLFAALATATTTKPAEPLFNVDTDPFPDPSWRFLDEEIPLTALNPSLRHTLGLRFYQLRQVIHSGNYWYWHRTVRPGSGLQLCSHSHVEKIKCRSGKVRRVWLYRPSNCCRGIERPWRDHRLEPWFFQAAARFGRYP